MSALLSARAGAAATLDAGLAALGLSLGPEVRRKLLGHLELLAKWNAVHNLTAIRDAEDAVSVHLLDSLAIASHLACGRALDVGSGGGFPGLPLALARPDLQVTLLDSIRKKASFLRQAVTALPVGNAAVVCARVESWQAPAPFDVIVSRAFSELPDFVARTRHLLAPGGSFAAMKGRRPEAELAALPPEVRVRDIRPLHVPGVHGERHLVLIEAA